MVLAGWSITGIESGAWLGLASPRTADVTNPINVRGRNSRLDSFLRSVSTLGSKKEAKRRSNRIEMILKNQRAPPDPALLSGRSEG